MNILTNFIFLNINQIFLLVYSNTDISQIYWFGANLIRVG